ncbi:ABC transporter substrate-binding protein [Nocardia sp. XZ_19_385]|uniref:ABC transporter substrate-binding protein n=1 Tax=Nocardia sp. XZ_19_385 TaxID=2769488 RepID=UPI0018908ADA|nr:ABC transporter substrate-binding protein [Nocardia sp. XZ_19_385]
MNSSSPSRLAIALVSVAALLSACADNNAPQSPGIATTIDNAVGKTYSGSTGNGNATGSPIMIGLVNQQGGPVSNPEFTVAAQAAADYINDQLGGVGGRPVTLHTCDIVAAESQGQKCGQEMLANQDVQFILQAGLNVGTQSLHATLNGAKPVLVAIANPGPDVTAKNTYAINASSLAGMASTPLFLKNVLKAKTAAMIADDNPGNQLIANRLKAGIEAQGIAVRLTTYPAGSADLVSPLTAAGAQKVDVILPIAVTPTACIATAKAYQQLGLSTPLQSSGLCASDAVKKGLGDFPKWIFSGSLLNIHAPDDTGQVPFYRAVMAKYAPKGAELGINAPAGFAGLFTAADILNQAGPEQLSADTIAKAAAAFTGPVLLGSPKLKFGVDPAMPTIGSRAARYYRYEGADKWVDISNGWLNLPE